MAHDCMNEVQENFCPACIREMEQEIQSLQRRLELAKKMADGAKRLRNPLTDNGQCVFVDYNEYLSLIAMAEAFDAGEK